MKKTLLVFILLIAAFSCSKKDDPAATPTPIAPACKVKKITKVYTTPGFPNSTETRTFDYNPDNTLAKITYEVGNSSTLTIFNYSNGVITSSQTGTTVKSWTVQNGKLIKITGDAETNLTYASDGRMEKFKTVGSSYENTYTPLFDTNGNLRSDDAVYITTGASATTQGDSRTYSSYDGFINPYTVLANSMKLAYYSEGGGELFFPEAFNKNNPGMSVEIIKDITRGTSNSISWTYQNEYTGNYASKITKSASGRTTTTVTFEYTGCN